MIQNVLVEVSSNKIIWNCCLLSLPDSRFCSWVWAASHCPWTQVCFRSLLFQDNCDCGNGPINAFIRWTDFDCFFLIQTSERLQSWMVLFDLLLLQFLGSQFLVFVLWMFKLVQINSFCFQKFFFRWFQRMIFILLFIGFKVETESGVNASSAPF